MRRAHLVQLDIAWEDAARNYARVRELLVSAPVTQGDLILLPEMFDTGFSLNTERTADRSGASRGFLASLARDTGAIVVGGFTIDGPGPKALNRLIAAHPSGRTLAQYDKIHPFTYGREGERFQGGTSVVSFPWGEGPGALTVCPAICYDLRFPELFRRGLDQGAQCYAIIANWPEARAHHWRALIIARAIENQAFVLGVNRAGRDPHLAYAGGSLIVDSKGAVIAEADGREQVLSGKIDAEALESWRREFPAWRDQSPHLRQIPTSRGNP